MMILWKMSFCFMIASRESTQRLSWTLPWRIPIPYGPSRKMSFVSFAFGSVAAISASDVSSNMTASARPWLNASTAFVTLSMTTTSVPLKQRFIQRS